MCKNPNLNYFLLPERVRCDTCNTCYPTLDAVTTTTPLKRTFALAVMSVSSLKNILSAVSDKKKQTLLSGAVCFFNNCTNNICSVLMKNDQAFLLAWAVHREFHCGKPLKPNEDGRPLEHNVLNTESTQEWVNQVTKSAILLPWTFYIIKIQSFLCECFSNWDVQQVQQDRSWAKAKETFLNPTYCKCRQPSKMCSAKWKFAQTLCSFFDCLVLLKWPWNEWV